jgi:hypothetical protein
MQIFGIEVRKADSVNSLFRSVDFILAKKGIAGSQVDESTKSLTVAHALQNMFKVDGYFDICTVRNCADVFQISIPRERMDVYRAIHCIKWNQMEPEYRETITAMVLDDFRVPLQLISK